MISSLDMAFVYFEYQGEKGRAASTVRCGGMLLFLRWIVFCFRFFTGLWVTHGAPLFSMSTILLNFPEYLLSFLQMNQMRGLSHDNTLFLKINYL